MRNFQLVIHSSLHYKQMIQYVCSLSWFDIIRERITVNNSSIHIYTHKHTLKKLQLKIKQSLLL